ncbi:HAD-IA family hydrolase [Oceaniglobus roseus]|uniref:HAD-IA family hydrolase n=1 Tax=Oceaniglobus roseus TaxID=1737570 RepID=UPI000C7E8944|nr:HAD-IA family hydrolase [Kandeliimicrobium roseum]
MTIDAVIFDIGNVLLEWSPHRYYDSKIGEDRRRALFDAVPLEAMNLSIDGGAPFRETIYATADAHPEWRDEIRDWHDNWIQLASPAIPQSVAILRALRAKGIPVFTLTNFGVESFTYAQTQYDFLNEFDREYVSGRLRLLKPDPNLYAHVERDCGIAPDRLLFADDKAENIAAAAARGWQTHLFDGPEPFAARLVAEGLLSAQEAA